MPVETAVASFPASVLHSFAFVLARVGGAIAFVPMPGFRNAPTVPKIVLILAVTLALLPAWPLRMENAAGVGQFELPWLLAEMAFGVSAGILLAWLIEGFVLAMQVLGLQAGYAYASTIDPTTQADASTLQVMAQLTAALLFVILGLDREVLRAFAASLAAYPPGTFRVTPDVAQSVIGFSGSMIVLAVRLALPLVSLLILVDVALALLGRINASLQLLTLAFPAKMLTSMAVLAALTAIIPVVFREGATDALGILWRVAGRTP